MFYVPMQWDVVDKPAPQPVTHGELLTVLDLLKRAGMTAEDEIYCKFKILADYARKRTMQTGRAYIQLKAE